MAYKLESDDHGSILKEIFSKWTSCDPDVFFVSLDGLKIFTHRYELIGLYLSRIADIKNFLVSPCFKGSWLKH